MSADYLQVVLVLGGLGLSALLIYLVSSGRIKNFSVSIKDWFSLKAEGHPSKSVEKSGAESSTQEPSILDQVHRSSESCPPMACGPKIGHAFSEPVTLLSKSNAPTKSMTTPYPRKLREI